MRIVVVFCITVVFALITAVSAADRSTVAVIASDMPHLKTPTSRDDIPSDASIEAMVREAMELGGIRDILKPDAKHVLLKPCVVVAKRDPQRNTDPRVVKAVALVVHDIAPNARITIGEGPGAWMKEARPEVKHWEIVIADGFETEGYYKAVDDPRLKDAKIEFVDLNFAEPRLVRVPGGGWARDEYWIAAPVLDADVSITIPRLKTHFPDLGGITVAMKNQMGVAPGMKYGWPKKTGYPSGSGNPGIPHSVEVLGEMITDLNLCARMDFAVAESFRREIDEVEQGLPEWVNVVVAGRDLVAVDAVSAYLMGFNPEEVETVVNGERRGLGVGRMEAIDLRGETNLARIQRGFPQWRSNMGMANRTWIISGPYPRTEEGMTAVNPMERIHPGSQGFGESVWFQDDKCDLGQLLGKPTDCVAFAYCEFDAPRTEPAQLQVASDEGMTLWLNGVEVYQFKGWRRIERPNEMVPVEVRAGRNTILCRLDQSTRQFLFSVNVVTARPDPLTGRYHRIPGLRFSTPGASPLRDILAQDVHSSDHWLRRGWWRDALVNQTRPDSIFMEGVVAEALRSDALGVLRGRYLGDTMRLRALTRRGNTVIRSTGVAELWANLGRLHGKDRPVTVSVVETILRRGERFPGLVEVVHDSSVVWSGKVPGTPIIVLIRPDNTTSWRVRWVAAPPPAESGDVVIGETTGELGSDVFTLGLVQSTGGILLADSYRELTGVDLGVSLAWDIFGEPVPAGPVTRGALFDLIRRRDARLVSWTMTGAQVKLLLEGLLDQSQEDARSTPQLSGVTATVDMSKPAGNRVVSLSLKPDRTYRIATLNRYTGWFRQTSGGDGDGKGSDLVEHPMTPIQAVEAFLARHRPYTPVKESRLIVLNVPAK